MKLCPTKDRVIINPAPREHVRESGLIVKTGTHFGHHCEGQVVAVGPLVTTVKQGDRVLYADDAFREDRQHERLPHPFRPLLAVREGEVDAVLDADAVLEVA